LRPALHNPNATSNVAKMVMELAEFELDFILHHAVKSQVLPDFVEDGTPPPCHPGGSDGSEPEPRAPAFTPAWKIPKLTSVLMHGSLRSLLT
jgi:hypothetical protein